MGVQTISVISLWETGVKGVGKSVLEQLCWLFETQPYEFFIDDSTPIAKEGQERELFYKIREAEALHLGEDLKSYVSFRIQEKKKDEDS